MSTTNSNSPSVVNGGSFTDGGRGRILFTSTVDPTQEKIEKILKAKAEATAEKTEPVTPEYATQTEKAQALMVELRKQQHKAVALPLFEAEVRNILGLK